MSGSFKTTYSHDYRWSDSSCLVPRAEAPSPHCRAWYEGADKPWCGRGPPTDPPRLSYQPPLPPVCYDLMPARPAQPWCQRGLLVPQTSARKLWPTLPAPARPQYTSQYTQTMQGCEQHKDDISRSPGDLLRRNYHSTYRADYCRQMDDIVSNIKGWRYDVSNKHIATTSARPPCKCGCCCGNQAAPTGDGDEELQLPYCRPPPPQHVHFSCCSAGKRSRANHYSSSGSGVGSPYKHQAAVGRPEKLPPWVSEYTDSIGRTARIIMERRLLKQNKCKRVA